MLPLLILFILFLIIPSASAPDTTSMISVVIEACRTRFIVRVSESINSPAFFVALSIAVMRARARRQPIRATPGK